MCKHLGQSWGHIPIFRSLRQEDHELKASLDLASRKLKLNQPNKQKAISSEGGKKKKKKQPKAPTTAIVNNAPLTHLPEGISYSYSIY